MAESTMPVSAQAAAVRAMLTEDESRKSRADKLQAIGEAHPALAAGVEAVLKEGDKPKPAGSGSAPHEPLNLANFV